MVNLSSRELATIRAALRHWQSNGNDNARYTPTHLIASDFGRFTPMSDNEIDILCEEFNA